MTVRILVGDVREKLAELPDESVHCVVTSPPYWGLRDYGVAGQIGLEPDFRDYIRTLVEVFREVRRVLRRDGTLWLNLGDSYAGGGNYQGINSENTLSAKQASNRGARGISQALGALGKETGPCKPKDLMLMPARIAIALQEDSWWLRQHIIWSKPNPMPESVTDRCTKSHEYLFLLSKSATYYYDAAAIRETAETDDLRRPYGSQGAWALDGRPEEQRHGGELRKVPSGWDTGPGDHRSASGRYRQPNSPGAIKSPHGQGFTRRALGEHGEQAPREDRQSAGARMGRGAGWRDDPTTTPFSRNKRSVWTIATAPFGEAHFATFPPALVEPCILAGCPKGGTVLDPFGGAGTTGLVADRLGRNAILIELNPDYANMARRRLIADAGFFADVAAD